MLGLFGNLNLGARALQAQQKGVEVTGHNIANVNNPAYSRQRLAVQTSTTLNTAFGPQGTGVDATSILRLRNTLLDRQLQSESSIRGYLESYRSALEQAQAALGQQVDRQAHGAEGVSAASGIGSQHSLAAGLSRFFAAFQAVSTQPASMAERQVLLLQAQQMCSQFQLLDQRLGALQSSLDSALASGVEEANRLLEQIAKLNQQIGGAEVGGIGVANDLRDLREQKLEALSRLVRFEVGAPASAQLTISIQGVTLVSGPQVSEVLEVYDAGGGQRLVRSAAGGVPLPLTGGEMAGLLDVRDGEMAALRSHLNRLAEHLMGEVNVLHAGGYNLSGGTGTPFFAGSNASDIRVHADLAQDPGRIQAAGAAGEPGNNQVALAIAQLEQKAHPALAGLSFGKYHHAAVAELGQWLQSTRSRISDQDLVERMLQQQRDSVSGVSLDEEMTELIKFQKAYAASARFITTIDELLDTVLTLKR